MKVKKPAAKSLLSFAFATLLPFMAGIFCALSMAPASWWPLLFAGFSLFYITLAKAGSAGRAALSGFFFGLGYFLKGLWWIGNALLVEGNDYAWVWPLAVMGLPTLLALFTSVAAALSRVTGDLKTISGFLVFCAVMALSEWVRGHIFTGFPWNLYAYAWSENLPLLQTLSLTGPYGLTLLTIFWAALGGYLYVSPQSLNRKMLLTFSAVFLFIACFSFGSYRLHTSADESTNRNIALRVIQPNIRQDLKWLPDLQGLHFEKHLKLSAPSSGEGAPQASTTLIIWPETSVPPVIFESPAGRDKIKNMLSSYKGEVYLLAGVLRREKGESGQTDYYNSIVLFDKKGRVRPLYDKTHLVPFGEYIPLQKWIPLRPVVEFTGFQRGAGPQTIIEDSIPPSAGWSAMKSSFPERLPESPKRGPTGS